MEQKTEETINNVKNIILANPKMVAVVDTKPLHNGKIIVRSKDQNAKNNLCNLLQSNDKLQCADPRKSNPIIILKGAPIDISKEKVISIILDFNESIKNQIGSDSLEDHIKILFSKKNHNSAKLINYGIVVTPKIREIIVNKLHSKLSFGYRLIHAEDSDPVIQCYYCQAYGHTSLKCQNKIENRPQKCPHCGEDHSLSMCPNRNKQPKCSNCHKHQGSSTNGHPHKANSKDCPIYKSIFNKVISRVNYG